MTDQASTLASLAHRYWEQISRFRPTEAWLRGDHRFAGELENRTRSAEDEATAGLEAISSEVEALDPQSLSTQDRITRAVLLHQAGSEAAELRSRYAELDVNPVMGFHVNLPSAASQFPINEPTDAEA